MFERVYVYNENCVQAGQACVDMHTIEEYENDPDGAHDIHHYELDCIQAEIEYIEKIVPKMPAGRDLYYLRIARTLSGYLDFV